MTGFDPSGLRRMAEQAVGGFADLRNRCVSTAGVGDPERPVLQLVGAKPARCFRETADFVGIIEAVEGFAGVAAQHHRVCRIERQVAAGEAM